MKATIYDIAKEAGVSIATVSNVMNGKGRISKKRREEILGIMERLQYKPSVIASALMGKRTFTLGLLIPDVANPFFAEIARAVEDEAHQAGYSLIICSTDNKDEKVERYLKLLEQKSVDGIMIGTGIENIGLLRTLQQKSVPIVMIAREAESLSAPTVVTDDFLGGTLAARHLAELGHYRVAVLTESLKVSSSRERIRGFAFARFEAGMALNEESIVTCDPSIVDAKRGAMQLLRQNERPTAIFCSNDLLAVGALQAAKEEGLQVPNELSVIGFDNTILSGVTDPPLTTVAQPMEQMARLAFSLLMDNPESKSDLTAQRIVLRPELIVRKSTASVHPELQDG